jgi:hypothetical protein
MTCMIEETMEEQYNFDDSITQLWGTREARPPNTGTTSWPN